MGYDCAPVIVISCTSGVSLHIVRCFTARLTLLCFLLIVGSKTVSQLFPCNVMPCFWNWSRRILNVICSEATLCS